jgi:hypothetical protein
MCLGPSEIRQYREACAIDIAEGKKDFQQATRLRKQLIKIQDVESEISTQIQNYIDSKFQYYHLPLLEYLFNDIL